MKYKTEFLQVASEKIDWFLFVSRDEVHSTNIHSLHNPGR